MMRKKRMENQSKKFRQPSRHSVLQKLIGGMICGCLIAALMPVEYYGFSSTNVQAQELIKEDALQKEAEPEERTEEAASEKTEPDGELSETADPGKEEDSEEAEPGAELPGTVDPEEKTNPEETEPGVEKPGTVDPEEELPETDDPEKTGPEETESGEGMPEIVDPEKEAGPGETEPGEMAFPEKITAEVPQKVSSADAVSGQNTAGLLTESQAETVTYTASFYSGSDSKCEKITSAKGESVEFPTPMEMEGWTFNGWTRDKNIYRGETGNRYSLYEDRTYYATYFRDVMLVHYNPFELDYEPDYGPVMIFPAFANVHDEITYKPPEFIPTESLVLPGCTFLGWDKDEYSITPEYPAGVVFTSMEDLKLYAIYGEDTPIKFYSGESGQYEEVTAAVSAKTGQGTVAAPELKRWGDLRPVGWAVGSTMEDGGKVYAPGEDIPVESGIECYGVYEMDITLSYDNNGASGVTDGETKTYRISVNDEITYGMPEFTLASAPKRDGYSFRGWSLKADGSGELFEAGCRWIFDESVRFYAAWVDDIPPVLEEAVYEPGYKGLFHWMIGKSGLTIRIPVTEEGSGVDQAWYALIPEEGDAIEKEAQIPENEEPQANRVRVLRQSGQRLIQFTISEDFKGTVVVWCSDRAGNRSAEKMLNVEDGGVIVEDNAPGITFSAGDEGIFQETAVIHVTVEDAAEGTISGGLAGISYQIDDSEEVHLSEDIFNGGIVEEHSFVVEISEEGRHTLQVLAVDNAGNESIRQITVNIGSRQEELPEEPGKEPPEGEKPGEEPPKDGEPGKEPPEGEKPGENLPEKSENVPLKAENTAGRAPKTGDGAHIEIYATVGMIAGLSYLLLYFKTEGSGMTEEKKDEHVARLIRWAMHKSGLRKMLALGGIFLLLAYYHSIGKAERRVVSCGQKV